MDVPKTPLIDLNGGLVNTCIAGLRIECIDDHLIPAFCLNDRLTPEGARSSEVHRNGIDDFAFVFYYRFNFVFA